MNDIYKKCIVENNALMVNRTYNNPFNWRNIGFYLDKYTMVLNMDLIRALKSIVEYLNYIKQTMDTLMDSYLMNLWNYHKSNCHQPFGVINI